MKRSFYQMLDLRPDADQACIDAAYAALALKLNSVTASHDASQTLADKHLLREGYRILSDPALRADYDAKLLAAEAASQVVFFSDSSQPSRRIGVEILVFGMLASALGGVAYHHLTGKMANIRVEHQQTVAKKKEEQSRAIMVNTDQPGNQSEGGTRKGPAPPAR